MRTVSEAVIRISLSFLQDCSASLGPMSTAWLWERLGDAACPRRKLILEPAHISKDAGTQAPAHSCSSSPQPSSLSNEHSILLWGGLGKQCSLSRSGQLSKAAVSASCLGTWEGPPSPAQVSASQWSALTFNLVQANARWNCKRSFQPFPPRTEAVICSDGTGFLSGC